MSKTIEIKIIDDDSGKEITHIITDGDVEERPSILADILRIKQRSTSSWENDVDRQSGAFTQEEIEESLRNEMW